MLAIVAVVSAVGYPNFLSWSKDREVRQAAEKFAGLITSMNTLTQRGTYPIEIFSEMHYSQAYKNQEPPRLDSVETAQKFLTPEVRNNNSKSVLDSP